MINYNITFGKKDSIGCGTVMKPPLMGQEDISLAYDNTDRRTGLHYE